MADWDTTNPDDNDIVSQYPSNERAARTAVVANFGVDHHATDDADVGKHTVIQIIDTAATPTLDTGDVGIWNDGGLLKTSSGSGVTEVGGFPSGTTMVFYQATTPVGWTRLPPSPENDSVLRVVSAAADEDAGTSGGSWTISGLTVQGHALTNSQMPSHNHGGGGNTGLDGSHSHSGSTTNNGGHRHTGTVITSGLTGGGFQGVEEGRDAPNFNIGQMGFESSHNHSLNINANGNHRHTYNIPSQGGGNAHSHGISHNGNWRPKYLNVLVASKD